MDMELPAGIIEARSRVNHFQWLPLSSLDYESACANLDSYIFVCIESEFDDATMPVLEYVYKSDK